MLLVLLTVVTFISSTLSANAQSITPPTAGVDSKNNVYSQSVIKYTKAEIKSLKGKSIPVTMKLRSRGDKGDTVAICRLVLHFSKLTNKVQLEAIYDGCMHKKNVTICAKCANCKHNSYSTSKHACSSCANKPENAGKAVYGNRWRVDFKSYNMSSETLTNSNKVSDSYTIKYNNNGDAVLTIKCYQPKP